MHCCSAQHLNIHANLQLMSAIDGHRQKKELYKLGFGSPACSMLYLPTTLDSTARTVMVGFADGVVRALLMCSDAWKVTATFKPHSGAISMLVPNDGAQLQSLLFSAAPP